MKKIACFLAVAACVACNYDVCEVSGEDQASNGQGELVVTIEHESLETKALTNYTTPLTEENTVKSTAVYVFDKATGNLNAYKKINKSGEECVFSVTTGEKLVCAVMNVENIGAVTTLEEFDALIDDLSGTNIADHGLVMVGRQNCIVRNGETSEPRVTVKRLVARVVLTKVINNVPPQYGDIEVNCVYLGNANTIQTYGGTPSVSVNPDGYAAKDKTQPIGKNGVTGSCPGYMYRDVSGTIATGAENTTKYHLYCQPSDDKTVTCMYLLVTIGGSQYYYRVPLKNGLEANKTYSVELEIVNLGSLTPPDSDVQKGEIMPVVTVSGWGAGDSYVVEF